MMHCHCGTNNRAPRWTFTDPCKLEVRPGAREESASPAWFIIILLYFFFFISGIHVKFDEDGLNIFKLVDILCLQSDELSHADEWTDLWNTQLCCKRINCIEMTFTK